MTTCGTCGQMVAFDGAPCPRCSDETTPPGDTGVRVFGGRYRLLDRIGGGAWGDVYAARHVVTGGKVALKLLKPDHGQSELAQRRFAFEASATHRLVHPNTVRVIDTGVETTGQAWIAMEWLEGQTLEALVRQGGPLPEGRAVEMARQILGSLSEAHAQRLVHRDIKPPNIFVVAGAGTADPIKVLDFGVARDLDRSGVDTINPIGTPRYMAPEVWLGAPVSPTVDVFAVGCVVFFMLTGHNLYEASREEDEGPRERVVRALRARGVSERLIEWVAMMTAYDRASRPRDASQALLALETCHHRRRTSRAWVAMGGAVAIAVAVGIGSAAATSDSPAHTSPSALQPTHPTPPPAPLASPTQPATQPPTQPEIEPEIQPAQVAPAATTTTLPTDVITAGAEVESVNVPLLISPAHARLSIDDGESMPAPAYLEVPSTRGLRLALRAQGYEVLRVELDMAMARALAGEPLRLTLKRRQRRSTPPELDLQGLDIPTEGAHP